MQVRPKWRKQDQDTFLWTHGYVLKIEFRFASRPWAVVQIPDCNQLTSGKFTGSAIDMPVIKLAGGGSLQVVSDIMETIDSEKWMEARNCRQSPRQGMPECLIDILPVFPAADSQIR